MMLTLNSTSNSILHILLKMNMSWNTWYSHTLVLLICQKCLLQIKNNSMRQFVIFIIMTFFGIHLHMPKKTKIILI